MTVRLQPASDDDLPTLVTWLAEPETARWLDSGAGRVALGDQRLSGRGPTTQAVPAVLEIASGEVGLDAINAWTVVESRPSARSLETAGYRLIGRQRRCHYIDDRPRDRLLFDRLSSRFDGTDG
jgi:RimJ/RimL family protein N-acetyltransferase